MAEEKNQQKELQLNFKENENSNDVAEALDWNTSNPLIVNVGDENFVLNAGEHQCCFHFVKEDLLKQCKLKNKLVGINMDFYRCAEPEGVTANLINYYYEAGNIPRENMFRRQYFCWTHLGLLTGVRPKQNFSEATGDLSVSAKLYAVSMIPDGTLFACFCNSPALIFRDIADYAAVSTEDDDSNAERLAFHIRVNQSDSSSSTDSTIQYIPLDDRDKTEDADFSDEFFVLRATKDIYGDSGEKNHVEIKCDWLPDDNKIVKLQIFNKNIVTLPDLAVSDAGRVRDPDAGRVRDIGNKEVNEIQDSRCPFIFMLFCEKTFQALAGDEVVDKLIKKLLAYSEPNVEIIYYLKDDKNVTKSLSEKINFLVELKGQTSYKNILATVTPDEYESIKKNFLKAYPTYAYTFNYFYSTTLKNCGSIIKYFRLVQKYKSGNIQEELRKFFIDYKDELTQLIASGVPTDYDEQNFTDPKKMIYHVAFSRLKIFITFRNHIVGVVVP